MAIYLVDYENVYIEGLSGIEQLTEDDTLHIFYTQNRCGLTFGLYEQLIACRADVKLNEVSVSPRNGDPIKNALDLQLMMFTGYLIGTKCTDKLYIVSKDKDFLLGTDFFANYIANCPADDAEAALSLELVPSVAASLAQPDPEPVSEQELSLQSYDSFLRSLQEQLDEPEEIPQKVQPSFAELCERYAKSEEPAAEGLVPETPNYLSTALLAPIPPMLPEEGTHPAFTVQYHNTVRNLLGKSTDEETVSRVCEMISASDSLVAFINALARYYRDGQRTKQIYHKFKPKFENLRHLSKVRKG